MLQLLSRTLKYVLRFKLTVFFIFCIFHVFLTGIITSLLSKFLWLCGPGGDCCASLCFLLYPFCSHLFTVVGHYGHLINSLSGWALDMVYFLLKLICLFLLPFLPAKGWVLQFLSTVVLSFLIWFSLKGLHRLGMDDADGFSRVTWPFMNLLFVTQDGLQRTIWANGSGICCLMPVKTRRQEL